MKVLIVQQKSLMVETNPVELRKNIIEQIKDGRVVLLPTTVMYEVVEFDEVEIPKSGGEYGGT